MTLEEKTIFIADSHYNNKRTILLDLLKKIDNDEIKIEQLFLMGDIFDFLDDQVQYFQRVNEEVIMLLNDLSKKIEIVYLEGNHDFNLKDIFPDIKVFSRSQQPIYIQNKDKNIALSHGDIVTPFSYEIFTAIIRNKIVLKFLDLIDINNWLTKAVEQKLMSKNICTKHESFIGKIEKRKEYYNSDLVIEGHFHQGVLEDHYINIPSLCCDKTYLVYENSQFRFDLV